MFGSFRNLKIISQIFSLNLNNNLINPAHE